MLSGETAVGQYPRESVEMMHRIALATEELAKRQTAQPHQELYVDGLREITEATTYAAGRLAEQLDARILLVASASGHTALVVAKHRHYVPVIGVSHSDPGAAEDVPVLGCDSAGRSPRGSGGASCWNMSCTRAGRRDTWPPAIVSSWSSAPEFAAAVTI